MTSTPLPFPADLEALAAPGMLETLSSMELGATYRLARFAWGHGCALPDDASFLAAVARITIEEFTAMRCRVLLALAATQAAPGEPLVLEVAQRANHAAADAFERRRQRTTAATEAAALAKRSRSAADPPAASVADPSRIRDGSVTDPSRKAAQALRTQNSDSALALPLQRSIQSAIQSAPIRNSDAQVSAGARAPETNTDRGDADDVIAIMGDASRAQLSDRVAGWQREQSTRMLQDAIARWAQAGATSCPVGKAAELARGEHADPARVDFLIEEAAGILARHKAAGESFNPVGYVIAGLGASARTAGRPREVPIFVAERWAKRQSETLRVLEAQAAIAAKVAAARGATRSSHG